MKPPRYIGENMKLGAIFMAIAALAYAVALLLG
jgi:hypothetical protein